MLILTRKPNETLNIGENIQVTVLGIKGNQVRIGINAPRDVPVHREEIYQRIKREERQEVSRLDNSTLDTSTRGADYFEDDSLGNR